MRADVHVRFQINILHTGLSKKVLSTTWNVLCYVFESLINIMVFHIFGDIRARKIMNVESIVYVI